MNAIKQYEKACDDILDEFLLKHHTYYEGTEDEYTANFFWVGDEIGGVCCINDDTYWRIDHILDALRCGISQEKLHDWYWDIYTNEDAKVKYSIKSYNKLK